MTEFIPVAVKLTISAFAVLSTMAAYILNTSIQELPADGMVKWVLGPMGALVLLLIAVGTLYKYLREKEKRIEELSKKMLEDAQEEADFWKNQAMKDKP